MNVNKTTNKEVIALAEHAKYYTDLLIKQCDNWLPEGERLKHVEKFNRKRKPCSSRLSGFNNQKNAEN